MPKEKKCNKLDFKSMKIDEIEEKIKLSKANLREERKKILECLSYLEMTSYFRANPLYKKSSFKTYCQDMFNIDFKKIVKEAMNA